jgi:hypothetical protein
MITPEQTLQQSNKIWLQKMLGDISEKYAQQYVGAERVLCSGTYHSDLDFYRKED